MRVAICLAGAVLLAVPIALPLYYWEYASTQGQSVIWAPVSLFVVFVLGLPSWMRGVHHCRYPWRQLGFSQSDRWWRGWAIAFMAGIVGITLLYGLQLLLGWSTWQGPGPAAHRFLLEGLLVGIGVGLAEELLFRGWLLYELEQDFTPTAALWLNALIFAIAHFLRPLSAILATWPQFVGLVLLGVALVWARRIPVAGRWQQRSTTVLGPAAGLHGGLVFAYYQVDVNDLVVATAQVPEWVTGIGGNPLAGLLGLGFLSVIGSITYVASHYHRHY
jgi:membrane protease YdiL (CAAX protease family)